jgi:hypothetical protein
VPLLCKKIVLGKKTEVDAVKLLKRTTTAYPTFKIDVEFPDSNSRSGKKRKSVTCPFCKKEFGYKAFRREFSLKSSAKWAGLLIGISVLLFLIAMVLFIFAEWDIDPAMWYFGLWGIMGFVFGVGFLLAQTLRYLTFYRGNKYRYFFLISELRSQHVTSDDQKRVMWKQLPVQT